MIRARADSAGVGTPVALVVSERVEALRLVGVVVVVLGFVLRLRVPLIVLLAGVTTGLTAKMPLVGTQSSPGILDTLGRAFSDGRIITLFVLALPAIGICERYGLQEHARLLVRRIGLSSVGRILLAYQAFRTATVTLGIRLGSGHVSFTRPLVVPMSLGAAGFDETSKANAVDRIKAAAAACENYGNFFAQNLFPAASGVAVIVRTLEATGHAVDARAVAFWTIPIALASFAVAAVQMTLLDRALRRDRS